MLNLVLKKSICSAIALLICALPAFALELDTSVDDEIRRNYNPSKLEQTLPALPKVSPAQSSAEPVQSSSPQLPPKTQPVTPDAKPQLGVKKLPNDYKYDKSTAIRIKKGTKFRVKSNSVISDYLKEGARVSFTTVKPVTQRYVTITEGTKFTAVVQNLSLIHISEPTRP